MRIGILTFTYGDNYGQRLQNIAVQEILHHYTKEVYTIPQVRLKLSLKRRIRQLGKSIIRKGFIASKRRHLAFNRFDKQYISYFDKFISESKFKSFPQNEFDFFVAGSDQIWSPFSPDVNSTMFLTFAEKSKRIALSPSIAAENIPNDQIAKYKEYFNGFNFLSIREQRGAELIKKISGRDAEVLIDPTLMFDRGFWDNVVKIPRKAPTSGYACCYFLGEPNSASKIDDICKKYNLNRINILNDKKYKVMGPSEFLYLIKNASVVITDSYHGCIFSTIFHVPFIMCERKGINLNMNSRFTTLFSKLGIEGRRLQDIAISDALNMDFDLIDQRIENEQMRVRSYLDKALNK